MNKFKVQETTKIITTYIVEAKCAISATNKVRNQRGVFNSNHTLDQFFNVEEIKEDNENDTNRENETTNG